MLQSDVVSDGWCCCGVTVMVSQCLEQAFAVEDSLLQSGSQWLV